MIVLLSMLGALQATPVDRPGLEAAITTLRTCVDRAAAELEPSGEAADIVADAARTLCDAEREAVVSVVRRQGANPASGARMVDQVLATLDDEMRSRTILNVTQQRAARRSTQLGSS